MAVFNIRTAADASFPSTPTNGQVLQYSASEGNKWTSVSLPSAAGFSLLTKNTTYTASPNDHILANASSASIAITLPSASTAGNGAAVRVTKTDTSANYAAVRPPAGTLLNGQTVTGTLVSTTKTADYTAASLDSIQANAASGSFTVTLPAATNGSWIRIVKTDPTVNAVLIKAPSGTIDSQVTAVVNSQYQALFFVADGTNWHFMPETYSLVTGTLESLTFVSDGTGWWTIF